MKLALVAMAIVVLAGLAAVADPAGASCAGPRLSIDRASVAIGGAVEIHGTGFGPCDDLGRRPLGRPPRNIAVSVTQTGAPVRLVVVDANADLEFRVRAWIPSTLQPGPATIIASGADASVALTPGATPAGVAPRPVVLTRGLPYRPPDHEQVWVLWAIALFVVLAVTAIVVTRRVRDNRRWDRSSRG